MRIITKREYFDPNWEVKRLEPKTCERIYVETDEDFSSHGKIDVGPFDTTAEAALWMKEIRMKENYND
jgi:hypothetical protein